MSELLFALTVALAHLSTNLDNIAVMLVLGPAIGVLRCANLYFTTQLLCITAAALIGSALLGFLGTWAGYLGIIPIGFGLYALRKNMAQDAVVTSSLPVSTWAIMAVFFSLGIDTIAVLSAIFSDTAAAWRVYAYLGALFSLGGLALTFVALAKQSKDAAILEKLKWLTPFALIAIGIYILSDTWSDVI